MADKNSPMEPVGNRSKLKLALFAGILGGVANILVDVDHLPEIWGLQSARMLHAPVFVGAGFIAVFSLARLGRLFAGLVLTKKSKIKRAL